MTELGEVRFSKPVAYQEIEGKRRYVDVSYKVSGSRYSFCVARYDKTQPLVIDPLLASTFLGGSNWDEASSIAIDEDGNIFVTGVRESPDFPTTAGAYDTTFNGGYNDVFISKLNNGLTNLLASTFLGGSYWDNANSP
ncbi:MAG: SBBP repeat-containing protein [Candidatus Omnitrophica bacterium]|nr:SBBP repeat-containing protein [Candidatus Omnitrophota bacterium]